MAKTDKQLVCMMGGDCVEYCCPDCAPERFTAAEHREAERAIDKILGRYNKKKALVFWSVCLLPPLLIGTGATLGVWDNVKHGPIEAIGVGVCFALVVAISSTFAAFAAKENVG